MAEPIQSKACDKCGAPAVPGKGRYTTTTHLETCAALAFFEALPFDAKPAEAPHPVTDQFGNIVGHSRTPHWSRAERHPVTGEVYLRRAGDPIVERPALSNDDDHGGAPC